MGNCTNKDITQPFTSIVPYRNRHTTDILILGLFIACWGFIGWITQQAITRGDPNRLILTHGINMNGSTCGVSADVLDQPYAAWPYPPEYDYLICLSSCNETTSNSNMILPLASEKLLYYCVPNAEALAVAASSYNISNISPASSYLSSSTTEALQVVGDVLIAWKVMIGSAAMTIGLCFVWLFFLHFFAGVVIWLMFASLIAGGFLSGYALLKYSEEISTLATTSATNLKLMRALAYTLVALSTLFFVILFALRKRIQIAVEVVKEASQVMNHMKSLIIFPLFPFAAFVSFLVAWIVIALYMYSVGTYTTESTPDVLLYFYGTNIRNDNPATTKVFNWDVTFEKYFAMHLFMLFWTSEFIIYFTFTVLAGAVADYYFTPKTAHTLQVIQDMETVSASQRSAINSAKHHTNQPAHVISVKPHGQVESSNNINHRMSRLPILASMARVLRFHAGTVLAAALIIAVIEMIRTVFAYIQARTRGSQSYAVKVVLSCVNCCLACLQSFVDKVNKNALIWCSIYGDGFVRSVSQSFQLVLRNLFRVAAINMVSKFLIVVGEIAVASATTGICLAIFYKTAYYYDTMHSLFGVSVIIFVLSFALSSCFMTVFHASVDTVFICFLVDCEENEKDGVMLASDSLRKLVQSYSKQSEIEAKIQANKNAYLNNNAAVQPTSIQQPQQIEMQI